METPAIAAWMTFYFQALYMEASEGIGLQAPPARRYRETIEAISKLEQ